MTEAMYDLIYLLEHITLTMLYLFLIIAVIKYLKGGNTNGN